MYQGDFLSLLERSVPVPPPALIEPVRPALILPGDLPAGRYPKRLMRSRKRGARLPKDAIWCGRGGVLGNPFRHERFGHARSILMHMKWLEGRLTDLELERWGYCAAEIDALDRLRQRVQRRLVTIRHRDCVCWCPLTSKWCHVDTILEHANDDLPPGWRFQ